jgi:hypothetical protein
MFRRRRVPKCRFLGQKAPSVAFVAQVPGTAYATTRGTKFQPGARQTELELRRGNLRLRQGITRASRRASTAPVSPALAFPLHANSNTWTVSDPTEPTLYTFDSR